MPTYTDLYVNVASSDWRDSSIMYKFQIPNFKKDHKKRKKEKSRKQKWKIIIYLKIEENENLLCEGKI